jgi:5,10-methylenetetrahydromethanopterin reductase
MTIGLIVHIDNPTVTTIRDLAVRADEAGADWLGLPDAFWWRDTWLLSSEAARETRRLHVGPLVTNPYLRHPFHIASAVATLQDLAGPRVILGLGAGGSELAGATGVSRVDAPERIVDLIALIRRVAADGVLDEVSARSLDVPLKAPRIIVAGRGPRVLAAAGRAADDALLWAVPDSELDRTVRLVAEGARERSGILEPVRLIWAPIVEYDSGSRQLLQRVAAYAVLNNRAEVRQRWGVNDQTVRQVRPLLVAGDSAAAEREIPASVAESLRVSDDATSAASIASKIGAADIALPITDVASVGDRVDWARKVLALAAAG